MILNNVTAGDYPSNALPFLKGVEAGYSTVLRTPLFEDMEPQDIADDVFRMVTTSSRQLLPELLELETKQRAKIGPISVRLPFPERVPDVESYYSRFRQPDFDHSEIRRMAGFNPYEKFPVNRLRPISMEKAANQLPKNTNSGLPLFRKRGEVLEESIRLANEWRIFPSLLGWRGSAGQTGDRVPKQRVVWMADASGNILEARYQQVALPFYQSIPQFAAMTDLNAVDKVITNVLDLVGDDEQIIATDFSKFDQTLGPTQQGWFFHRLENMFNVSFHSELEWLSQRLCNVELLCTTTTRAVGEHGMPSGSVFTNLCDSTVNLDVQMSSPEVNRPHLVTVLGDDGVSIVKDVSNHLKHIERCGFEVNSEKQYVSKKATVYLQRLHHVDYRIDGICRGVVSIMRALNSLIYQERFQIGRAHV